MALSGSAAGRHGRGDTRQGRSGFEGSRGSAGKGKDRGGLAPGGGLAGAISQPKKYTGSAAGRRGIQPGPGNPGGGTMGTPGADIKKEVERQFGKAGFDPSARDLTVGGVGGLLSGGPLGAALGLGGALIDSYNPGFSSPGGTVGGFSVGADSSLGGPGLGEPGGGGSDRDQRRVLPSGRAANQPAAVASGLLRPAARAMPPGMANFLNSSMTPLQMRTAIATMGTQGVGGSDDDAFDFWRNLFVRDFMDEGGNYRPLDDPYNSFMPVEQQYLSQLRGFTPPEGANTKTLLEALSAL